MTRNTELYRIPLRKVWCGRVPRGGCRSLVSLRLGKFHIFFELCWDKNILECLAGDAPLRASRRYGAEFGGDRGGVPGAAGTGRLGRLSAAEKHAARLICADHYTCGKAVKRLETLGDGEATSCSVMMIHAPAGQPTAAAAAGPAAAYDRRCRLTCPAPWEVSDGGGA